MMLLRLIVIALLCVRPACRKPRSSRRRRRPSRCSSRRTRSVAGADRALSRSALVRNFDRLDLSARGRASGPLGQVQQGSQGRCAHGRACQAELGRQREIAGRGSERADHDERTARLDAEARRRRTRPADRRHGRDPAAAAARAGQRQAQIDQEQTVTVKTEDQKQYVVIEPASPNELYVPYYEPAVVYGDWPYPDYAPYYFPPPAGYFPGGVLAAGIAFAAAVAVRHAFWGNCDWGRGNINVATNRSVNVNNINRGKWEHNPAHRQA